MSARVLIATTQNWPFAAQLAGAFAGAGAAVEALSPPGSMLALSRHPQRKHAYRALAPLSSLCDATAQNRFDMILPCDDQAADLVLRATGGVVIGRHTFLAGAREAGAPAVESMALDDDDALDDALARFGLPLVIKSDHSWGGEGVAICATGEEARRAVRRLKSQSRLRDIARALKGRGSHFLTRALLPVTPALSAERFITGLPATSSIACWQGAVVAAHHFDVLLSSTPTSPASVIRLTPCPWMEASARAVAKALKLTGLFGLDYVRDTKGAVHLLEMNARATPTMHLALADDLPAALLAAARLPARPRPPVTEKTDIALFPREWLRDPESPWLQNAFHDVPWDDPDLIRACVAQAPPARRAAAQALLGTAKSLPLTAQNRVFRA